MWLKENTTKIELKTPRRKQIISRISPERSNCFLFHGHHDLTQKGKKIQIYITEFKI